MNDLHPPVELLQALAQPGSKELQSLGTSIGKLYTDHGLPLDMALTELDKKHPYSKLQKIAILFGAQNWLIEHRRNSAATEKALDRQRNTNRESMSRFIKTGESGVY